MSNLKKGKFGEGLAEKYLLSRGYEIICKNWTCRWGEIDIISKKAERLVFVEVKYRSSPLYGYGHEAVNYYKIKKLRRSIQNYLISRNKKDVLWQVDVVSITKAHQRFEFQHFEAIQL